MVPKYNPLIGSMDTLIRYRLAPLDKPRQLLMSRGQDPGHELVMHVTCI